ncbi:MAG: rRNA pseudouridine synthase [Proteobacteria bacterium]|nr:rRNA pseudouridine synthase [Pseudomonadota bacterium]
MRLNVFLQRAGVGSRREAERLVEQGRVMVNGTVATPTIPVEEGDKVLLDGKPIAPATRDLPQLFLMNKPLDVLVTHRDPQGRPTVFDLPALLPPKWDKSKPRVMTVGRLDVNSEGLLVLSSDGPLAQTMMSPKTALPRVYRVRVHGRLKDDDIIRLRRGITIEGIRYRGVDIAEDLEKGGRTNAWYRVVLTEGKNREIRKLFEHFGCVVNRLIRVQYGPFELGNLESGEVREVSAATVRRFLDELNREAVKVRP